MRIIKTLILVLFFLGCKDSDKRNTPKNLTKTPDVESNLNAQPTIDIKEIKSYSKFPEWLTKLYPKSFDTGHQTLNQEINNFLSINDSISYYSYSQSDGICLREFIITLKNLKKTDSLLIADICDHELSIPSYSWKESAFIGKNTIVIMEYKESVNDSLIDENGKIKESYDFLEAETITDSIFTKYEINPKGIIVNVNNN